MAGGLMLPSKLARARAKGHKPESEAEVTPPDDLMREHGVLDRLLLIYEAGLQKFDAREEFDPAIITGAAQIVRDFIENYHEQSEEEAVFPCFRKAGKILPLVDILLEQHKAAGASRSGFCKTRPAAVERATTGAIWWARSGPLSRCTDPTLRAKTPISFRA
jgi:hypothetical protein